MQGHGRRVGYHVRDEGLVLEPQNFYAAPGAQAAAEHAAPPPQVSSLQFGWMFGRTHHETPPAAAQGMIDKLIRLGRCMSSDPQVGCAPPPQGGPDESNIPAGYTYLGQFIAHEITFDSTGDLLPPGPDQKNLRTPQIDLDSLYGPADRPVARDERDAAKLKEGKTILVPKLSVPFPNDLPRDPATGEALVGDPRNDENLTLAQTHLAFIKFHNKVVDRLRAEGGDEARLFDLAREQVVLHFQWIILRDFLPRLVGESLVGSVLARESAWLGAGGVPFMPLEFSAAAFRIGHTMVRASYEFNHYHSSDPPGDGPSSLLELFQQTHFSGHIGKGQPIVGAPPHPTRLPSDWVIDWRRFHDFEPLTGIPFGRKMNTTTKLDTVFDLHLERVTNFPDKTLERMQRAIAVRNLLRGFHLGLPTGEEAAERIGVQPLTHEQVADGPHRACLDDDAFRGRTPLWYYVLKEAELGGGNRLGPVGGHIVAETLVGLIRKSEHSILDGAGWQPRFGRPATDAAPARFEMIDLLHFADVVDPIGRHLGS